MKLLRAIIFLVVVMLCLTGMGNLGGGPEGTVPKVDENIRVKVTDRDGVTIELSEFSQEGKLALDGTLGSAQMTILFKNMASADFSPVENKEEMTVSIKLKDGANVSIKIRKRLIFYGSTGYGAYQIKARDLKRIEIL